MLGERLAEGPGLREENIMGRTRKDIVRRGFIKTAAFH